MPFSIHRKKNPEWQHVVPIVFYLAPWKIFIQNFEWMLSCLNLSIAPSLTWVLLLENRFLAAAAAVWSVHLGKGGRRLGAGRCIREQCRQLLFWASCHCPALLNQDSDSSNGPVVYSRSGALHGRQQYLYSLLEGNCILWEGVFLWQVGQQYFCTFLADSRLATGQQ